jgi:ElaB/YqjD/DUF883 family membrane-anchored ribosome-binding protein
MTRDMPKPNRSAANRNAREPESIAEQIDAIRSEIQSLTSTLGGVAAKQWGQAQTSAEESIRRNPFVAVGIAAGLGFLYAALRR